MQEKCCWNCKNLWCDRSVDAYDCKRADDMTEEEFEKYYIDEKPNCPYWEELDEEV